MVDAIVVGVILSVISLALVLCWKAEREGAKREEQQIRIVTANEHVKLVGKRFIPAGSLVRRGWMIVGTGGFPLETRYPKSHTFLFKARTEVEGIAYVFTYRVEGQEFVSHEEGDTVDNPHYGGYKPELAFNE